MIALVVPDLPSDRARLRAAFGETLFIHLSRADKLAQAVSLVKAEQTGLWHIGLDGRELERLKPPEPPQYDFARITAVLAELEQFDADWLRWFEAEAITPLCVSYEAMSVDTVAVVGRICLALGGKVPVLDNLTPSVAKLADATNAVWVRRYRLDLA